jgi:hypothetical protein
VGKLERRKEIGADVGDRLLYSKIRTEELLVKGLELDRQQSALQQLPVYQHQKVAPSLFIH